MPIHIEEMNIAHFRMFYLKQPTFTFMKRIVLISILIASCAAIFAQENNAGNFKPVELPYATDALEPVISKETMELHYGKHLQNYVATLNKLVKSSSHKNSTIEEILMDSSGPLFNNAGQVLNHNLFFTQFSPDGGGSPKGELEKAIIHIWGSVENFKNEFLEAGSQFFGSGWIWLSCNNNGYLYITQEDDGSNPAASGLIPLLGFDLWEHSYYLDYNNRKSEHLEALWQIVDWDVIGERFSKRKTNLGG